MRRPQTPRNTAEQTHRKGGETGNNDGDGTHPLARWVPVPKSLVEGLGTIRAEALKAFVWMAWRDWDYAERTISRGRKPNPEGVTSRLSQIAQGIGASVEMAETVLREMAREGYVEETPKGWRLLKYPQEKQ